MSNLSFQASLHTCKVDQGEANRFQSDRFLNPNQMLCPVWNGRDSAGRPVCADSFYTKSLGCNWAIDRVSVENDQRPRYSEYITLDAQGIRGPPYDNFATWQSVMAAKELKKSNNISGNFGKQWQANVIPGCGYSYEQAMAQEKARREQAAVEGYRARQFRRRSGN